VAADADLRLRLNNQSVAGPTKFFDSSVQMPLSPDLNSRLAMPTYDYACAACGGFDAIRSPGQRDEPAACPRCGGASPRVFVAAPQLALMEAGTRGAFEVNERARHEPKARATTPGCATRPAAAAAAPLRGAARP
jgi:putative FmdB family regulatory protein